MKIYSFKDIYNNPKDYDEAAAFWEEVAQRALSTQVVSQRWQPWGSPFLGDGSVDRSEGTAMTSYIARNRKKAFKIEPFSGGRGPIAFYADVRVFAKGEPEEVPNLTIMSVMDASVAKRVQKLIEEWLKPEMTPELMRQIIRRKRIGFRVKPFPADKR